MRWQWQSAAVVALVAGLVLLFNLGAANLWDIDEPRNAVCAREMLGRGDWVVPTFNGELRTHKPVLLYWLMMASYQLLGVSEFSARLASALCGIGTCLMTWQIGRRMFNPRVGLWAGMILATSLNFALVARAATPDSVFLLCITLTLGLFACRFSTGSLNWQGWAAVYAAMGAAVLAKGPSGAVLPIAVMGLFWLLKDEPVGAVERRENAILETGWRARLLRFASHFTPRRFLIATWEMRPLTLFAVVSLVALPWYVAVSIRTDGVWTREFLFTHNVSRFTQAMENHRGPIVYYLVAITIGLFPWSLLLAPMISQTWRRLTGNHPQRAGYLLLTCWAGVYIVFFSLAKTKLPNYVIPAYPALALLTALVVDRILDGDPNMLRWLPRAATTLLVVGVILTIGLPLVVRHFLPGEELLGLVGLVPLVGGVAALALWKFQQIAAVSRSFVATGAVFSMALLGVATTQLQERANTEEFVEWVQKETGATELAGFSYLRPSWVFYSGHTVPEFHEPQPALDFLRSSPRACLVTTDKAFPKLRPYLPTDVIQLAERPQFLKPGKMIVLGHASSATAQGASRVSTH